MALDGLSGIQYRWQAVEPALKSTESVRIHVYLAKLGLGSRRELEALIRDEKVLVNGQIAELGQKVRPGIDSIKIRKKLVTQKAPQKTVVYLFHKPAGVVTTVKDPQGRTTVMNFLPKNERKRLFPVGRLDLNSEGLLVLTNHGELAHRLMHPKYEVEKLYEVKIRGFFDEKKKAHLEKGIRIGKEKLQPVQVVSVQEVTKSGTPKYKIKLRVHEGKNHHIRKMFEAVGCRVIRLKRLNIANLRLRGIPRGECRLLTGGPLQKLLAQLDLGTSS